MSNMTLNMIPMTPALTPLFHLPLLSDNKILLALVNEDLQYLRLKAKDNISKYIEEYLPAEYENYLSGLIDILTMAWNMSTDSESDKRERIQGLTLAKECYAMKLDLLSSGCKFRQQTNRSNHF